MTLGGVTDSVPDRMHPRDRVHLAVQSLGVGSFVDGCAGILLGGDYLHDEQLAETLEALLGMPISKLAYEPLYWPRVWAARALLYAWTERAGGAVVHGLADPAWRVREMSAKVVALREIGDAAEALLPLLDDDTPRVRAAAARAVAAVGESEHVTALRELEDDPETDVRKRARQALTALARRLDRPLDLDDADV